MLPPDVKFYRPLTPFQPKCLVELEMLRFSQEIRRKQDWDVKVHKEGIAEKWMAEAVTQGMRPEAAQYVIDEVKFYSTQKDGNLEPGPVDGTWIAKDLIDGETLTKFKKLVAEGLENVPTEEKDFHPGSDDLVVDLVHPSLYCYVEDRSVLSKTENVSQELLPKETPSSPKRPCNWNVDPPSGKYRWMPAEVSLKDEKVAFDSYINNLHPIKHQELYSTIGDIFKQFIPLFNASLTDVASSNFRDRINLSSFTWYDQEFDFDQEFADDDDQEELYQAFQANRPILPVPVEAFKAPEKLDMRVVDLNGEQLQVIVKLANIELTPEKPKYNGGSWHVEGIAEERIVATGIYYYEMENITESKLMFRQSVDDPNYEQGDDRGVAAIYGMESFNPCNQELGHLISSEGLSVVFPNTYQHRVKPFGLVDKTKPGFRKILVFFLVDPTTKIISTGNVQPQQLDWDDVRDDDREGATMTRKEAEEFREKLMFERKYARDTYEKEYYEREFSLCEH